MIIDSNLELTDQEKEALGLTEDETYFKVNKPALERFDESSLEITDTKVSGGRNYRSFIVSWAANIGCGNLRTTMLEPSDPLNETDEVKFNINTEHMGKEFAKKVLCKIVDEAEVEYSEE